LRDTFTRRDKLVIAAKDVASFLPKLGLVKKPRFHPNGVSFIVPVKDEEAWIKPCIQSIEEVAAEIIVIDSSVVDKTTEIVALMAEQNPKIKHISPHRVDHRKLQVGLQMGQRPRGEKH
jgi:hypothetical protein